MTRAPKIAAIALAGALITMPVMSAQDKPAEAGGVVLSLHDAVLEALARNPELINTRVATDQAALALRVAQSAWSTQILPTMSGAFGRTALSNQAYGLDVSKRLTTGTQLRGLVASTSYQNQFGTYFNSDMTLQVTQPLLRGFGRTAAREVVDAEDRVAISHAQLGFAEQQLAVSVVTAYYTVVVQGRLFAVAQAALDRAVLLRDASAALLSAGRVSQIDVLRAEQLVGQTRARVLAANDALASAGDRLCVLIGRRVGESLRVASEIPLSNEPVVVPDLGAGLDQAVQARPEVIAAQSAIIEQERAIDAARSQLRPQLDIGVAVTRRDTAPSLSTSFGLDGFAPTGYLNVSMPIERTPEQAALQTALTERDTRRRALETTRDRVAADIRQAGRRLVLAAATLDLVRNNAALAEKEMEVAMFRFQRGLSSNLDVIAAQASYRDAQAEEASALAERAVAQVALRAAMGTLDPRQDVR